MLEAGTSRESGGETWFLAAEPDVVLSLCSRYESHLFSQEQEPLVARGKHAELPTDYISGSPARPVFPSLLSCGRALKSP